MKRLAGIVSFIVIVLIAGNVASAQAPKFGHINKDELIQALPDFDSARVQLEKYQKELVNYMELMQVELNNKSDQYQKEEKNLTDLVKQTKQQELIDMNRKIQEFQQSAQENYQNKQVELFQPVVAKVDKAIEAVGKENGFVYVFNIGQGTPLVYFDESKSTNIMTLAKAKLGLK
ncbi:MAG: OmpH family outer membrane protein [Bacteroidales bacterium]|nr:OmpH family outer membrane protein [Bacteroidales bacterium]MCU0408509.1 OmpH family outer membrane protein [Bacteroidales bacterium]